MTGRNGETCANIPISMNGDIFLPLFLAKFMLLGTTKGIHMYLTITSKDIEKNYMSDTLNQVLQHK
jgi:hypothetical protein